MKNNKLTIATIRAGAILVDSANENGIQLCIKRSASNTFVISEEVSSDNLSIHAKLIPLISNQETLWPRGTPKDIVWKIKKTDLLSRKPHYKVGQRCKIISNNPIDTVFIVGSEVSIHSLRTDSTCHVEQDGRTQIIDFSQLELI